MENLVQGKFISKKKNKEIFKESIDIENKERERENNK